MVAKQWSHLVFYNAKYILPSIFLEKITETGPRSVDDPVLNSLSPFSSVLPALLTSFHFWGLALTHCCLHCPLNPAALQEWDEEGSFPAESPGPTCLDLVKGLSASLRLFVLCSKQTQSQAPWRIVHFGGSNLQLSIGCLVDLRAKSELKLLSEVWQCELELT